MQIREQQSRDSVRIVWNVMAGNKTIQAKAAVPQALHYTPLQIRDQISLSHIPPHCNKCEAYMNPYNRIHISKTQFTCCICKSLNKLPQNYLIGQSQYPQQLSLNYSSFVLTQNISNKVEKMGFLFVIDISVDQKQLQSVKQSILDLVNTLEDDFTVGLITYNKFVYSYDLSSSMTKVHAFAPQIQYETLDFAKMLNIKLGNNSQDSFKYLNKLQKCRQSFTSKIQSLQRVKHVSYKHQRQARATGQALNLALSLNQLSQNISRIVFFCGGPCTVGAGKLIQQDYKIQMRSIKDETPKLSKAAHDYYCKLANKAKSKLIPIDCFIMTVEEVGLAEMHDLLEGTGGILVQHEQFNSLIFKQSFKKAYEGLQQMPPLEVASFCTINVKHSQQITITESFINRIERKESQVSLIVGNLDEDRSITFTYQLSQVNTDSEAYYIQIKTQYRYPQNLNILFQRVTTIRRLFSNFIGDLVTGFDQGAALALLAKLSVIKGRQLPSNELRHWLDNILCKWCALLGSYRSGQLQSFRLSENIKLFPQFIYHLRRNLIIRKSSISLDEFVYVGDIIKRQTVQNVILIIQPALLRYTLQNVKAQPVPLDQKYMKHQTILLLDSFFNIVQWRGKLIQEFYKQKHQSQEQHFEYKMLNSVESDICSIKNERFPVPHYYLTGYGHSKERFIKSRLSLRQQQQHETNLSDEVNVNTFTQKLIELVVNKKI